MSSDKKYKKAIELIDQENSKDPNFELVDGVEQPKELVYSERMVQRLLDFAPDATPEVQIAARAQHICRWKIERKSYPMDRVGYLKWRTELKSYHAELTSDILEVAGYDTEFIERVAFLIEKKSLKKDAEVQLLEDVVCLVFLEHYYEAFIQKHDDDKLVEIVLKTWKKMSTDGHEAALVLPYSERGLAIVKKALINE
jgi:hypothetical protein